MDNLSMLKFMCYLAALELITIGAQESCSRPLFFHRNSVGSKLVFRLQRNDFGTSLFGCLVLLF
jgi:hypothetical protein